MSVQRNTALRRICFTANNYGDGALAALKKIDYVRYACVGKEVGESGTPHLQGMATFTKPVKFNTIRKDFTAATGSRNCHIAQMIGSPEQASKYCKKDGDFVEWGDVPNPGKRNDLRDAVAEIQAGKTINDLSDDVNHGTVIVKYHKGLTFLSNELQKKLPLRKKLVVWIHGETGIGKTRKAMDFAAASKGWWISNESLKWFDGYSGQQVAIFDDLRYKHCSFSFLLRLLDRYELSVPIKGGFARWNPGVIFVTAPKTPREMFQTEWREEEDLRQIERRCTAIVKLPEDQPSVFWTVIANHIKADLALSQLEPANIVPTHGPIVTYHPLAADRVIRPIPPSSASPIAIATAETLIISDDEMEESQPCMDLTAAAEELKDLDKEPDDFPQLDLSIDSDVERAINAPQYQLFADATQWCYICRSSPCSCFDDL